MTKNYSTSLDYRILADELWEKAKQNEALGHFELASHLKTMSDSMHDVARKKYEEEQILKNSN